MPCHQILAKDKRLSIMLPCPISIYEQEGKTHISTMLPRSMATLYPELDLEELAAKVEQPVIQIIQESIDH